MLSRVVNLLSLVTLAGVGALIYLAFFDDVVPLRQHRIVALEGIGIGPTAYALITREVCFASDGEALSVRSVQRIAEDTGRPEEVFEQVSQIVQVSRGCSIRTRRVDLPDELSEGRYVIRTGLRFCNQLGRCVTAWLAPIGFKLVGEPARRLIRFERDAPT